MTKHQTAARWFAGLLVAGSIVAGAAAPVQAAAATATVTITSQTGQLVTADTGWNGT
jgi:hypothetical protein